VDLAETANTDGLAHVDVAGDGGGADVEPVDVLGGQLVGVYFCQRLLSPHSKIIVGNLRDVLTVSTQPVDKTVSKLIVQLSPSDGIQVLSFTRWNSTNLGFTLLAPAQSQIGHAAYMGSFPCLFKKAAYEVMNFCASTSLTVTPPILSVLLGREGLVGRVWSGECGAGLRDGANFRY